MAKKFIISVAVIAVIGGSATLFAEGGVKPNVGEGTLMVRGKSYAFKHAVAYETTIDDEEVIAVVLSGQTVSSEKLKEVRKADKEGESSSFSRPYMKLEFTKAGEFKHWSAGAGDTTTSGPSTRART